MTLNLENLFLARIANARVTLRKMAALLQSCFFLFIATTGFITPARASSICDSYKKNAPRMHELYCTQSGGGGGSAKPAGASSTFTESFKLNAASLPTEASPYGLEVISTFLFNGAKPGFPTLGLIKGFHRFGTGLSTAGANTFYSNPLTQRLSGPSKLQTLALSEPAKSSLPDFNLGTSFLLLSPSWGPSFHLGLSARYNSITSSWGGGPALLLTGENFTLGGGISREKVSNFLPQTDFFSFLISARYSIFELEYDFLEDSTQRSLSPIQILTTNFHIKNWVVTAAARRLNFIQEGTVTQFHVAVQLLLGRHLSLGYLYNYIPGGSSVGIQGFF